MTSGTEACGEFSFRVLGDEGCQEYMKDTAEFQRDWIDGLMQRGMCSCDEEHMFNCPKEMETMNSDKGHEEINQLDAMLDNLLNKDDVSGGN